MHILISNSGKVPIYEQISEQIKAAILDGILCPGDPLPGMRTLAKDLKISVITTKRAYLELENEGYITTAVGRGCFVSEIDRETLRENVLRKMREKIGEAVSLAASCRIPSEELKGMIDEEYGRQNDG